MSKNPKKTPKTILILNWRDPKHPMSGGAELSLLEHAKFWLKGVDNVVWFSSSFPSAKKTEVISGIRIIRQGSHFTVHLHAFFNYIFGRLGNPNVIIDCFHFIPFFTPFYAFNKKIICLVNEIAGNLWFMNLPLPFSFVGFILEKFAITIYKKIDFITGSNSASEDLVRAGISRNKISIIHHGANTIEKKEKKEKNPVLMFLGTLSKDKGIEDAINAFKKIHSINQSSKLWIIGKEEKKNILRSLIIKYSDGDSEFAKAVIYYGFVKEDDKFSLLRRSWLLVHPSKKEGWGLNVIEAASVGTPTVGYNVGGLKDSVVHNKTGILVSPNADALMEGISKVLEDKKLYEKLSENAIVWSKNFSWDKSIEKSWEIISKHIG